MCLFMQKNGVNLKTTPLINVLTLILSTAYQYLSVSGECEVDFIGYDGGGLVWALWIVVLCIAKLLPCLKEGEGEIHVQW